MVINTNMEKEDLLNQLRFILGAYFTEEQLVDTADCIADSGMVKLEILRDIDISHCEALYLRNIVEDCEKEINTLEDTVIEMIGNNFIPGYQFGNRRVRGGKLEYQFGTINERPVYNGESTLVYKMTECKLHGKAYKKRRLFALLGGNNSGDISR